jgi:hypothetical protein
VWFESWVVVTNAETKLSMLVSRQKFLQYMSDKPNFVGGCYKCWKEIIIKIDAGFSQNIITFA